MYTFILITHKRVSSLVDPVVQKLILNLMLKLICRGGAVKKIKVLCKPVSFSNGLYESAVQGFVQFIGCFNSRFFVYYCQDIQIETITYAGGQF